METAILFIILIVILLSNNGKVKLLTKQIETLDNKLDDLKQLLLNKQPKTAYKEQALKDKIAVQPDIVPEKIETEVIPESPIKIKETTFKEESLDKVKINSPKEKTLQSDSLTNKAKATDLENSIPQKTLGDKIQEKINTFKNNNPDIEKFIGENLISKIGILILVLGISFFVKFAIDNEWVNEIGRVGIGFLAGGILLGFAHKLQKNYKAFSSILVSGAITVFYFIITYAFKEYALFTQTTAFILLVVITVFSVAISVLYDRKELGVLSLIGGFAVPLLASTGSGNYVVLFSYLLILNIGFLILSIKKKWFIINVLTFLFTHIFFFSWLFKDTNLDQNAPKLFVFASLFYLVFYLINIFKVIKEKEYAMKPIVMSLFLVSSFVYFGQGLFLLDWFAPSLRGAFTLVLALINLASGWLLLKNKYIDTKTVYLFIGMTLTFLTLVGPIQLEGNYITLFWAAESTLLFWLSQKMKNNGFKIAGFITTALMTSSLLMDFSHIYNSYIDHKLAIIFNKGFATGIFATITVLISAYLFSKEKNSYFVKKNFLLNRFEINPSKVKNVLFILAGIIFYFTGLLELSHQASKHFDSYLSHTLITIYNFIFIISGIYFALKNKSDKLNLIGLIVSVITLLFSISFISATPFYAFLNSKLDNTTNPTIFVQFFLFLAAIYIIKLVYSYISEKSTNYTLLKYFIAIVFVVLVSLEVLIISQPILVNSKIGVNSDLYYSIIDTSKTAVIKTSFPILWGILSFIFLYFGIKKNKKEFRIFALVLVAITIIKLFTYDIGNVSQGGKIVAFIILGIVLLVISFMYQRIKKLFNDNENKEKK